VKRSLPFLLTVIATAPVCAQTLPLAPPTPASAPAAVTTAPATVPAEALDPKARELLQMLHDRRNTLRDFTANVDYMVTHPVTEETSGKRGTVDFIMDQAKGPIFTVGFEENIRKDGSVERKYKQQIIFDGVYVTWKDFPAKEFTHTRELPEGASPGDAVTLNGPMTLPIGLNVEDVGRNFTVTVLPARRTEMDRQSLRLVPRPGGGSKFDFRQLDITIDTKLELPVELREIARGRDGDITVIHLTNIQTNTGKAKMQDPTPPAGWTERAAKSSP
jgi:hypothetical protein